jgi:hypothetical protein
MNVVILDSLKGAADVATPNQRIRRNYKRSDFGAADAIDSNHADGAHAAKWRT